MENGILYIIGNGLDKYHKINTGYDDWYNYVKKRKNSITYLFLI
ncbi:bacteriophage abortive infection AbiH family protein [Bacteroides ovatus]|nr:bacteriophage abortive infection AbiH family protein [Bacteroides ovatus]